MMVLPVTQRNQKQHGSVLIVALVFMLLLTIIGVGAMQSATLQERMAGNTRDVNMAFQSAEGAIRAAEDYLQGASVGPFDGNSGLYLYCTVGQTGAACGNPDWREMDSVGWVKRGGSLDYVSAQPEYIIQQMPPIPDPEGSLAADEAAAMIDMYRVTARGFGISDNTMVVIQTAYRRN